MLREGGNFFRFNTLIFVAVYISRIQAVHMNKRRILTSLWSRVVLLPLTLALPVNETAAATHGDISGRPNRSSSAR